MKTNSTLTLLVTEDFVGQRLDRVLTTLPEITSRSYAQDLIDKKLVTVNQKYVRSSLALKLNQIIEISLPEVAPTQLIPYDFKLDIIFEDEDLIVINKPRGLVVHPAAGHEQDTLVNALLNHTTQLSMKNEMRPGIVHRIDKETSGLLVVAKNDFTHEALATQFKNKETHRIYYALVMGSISKKKGTIQSYLARHPNDRKRYSSLKSNNQIINEFNLEIQDGKWAVTHFENIAQSSGMSYIKLKLETGRTHQIRVHMSEQRHCLFGDLTYGFSVQKFKEEKLNRFYLHASELGFIHPKTNKSLLFKASWPEIDLNKILSYGFKKDDIQK